MRSITFKHVVGMSMVTIFGFVVHSLVYNKIPEANREIFVHMLGIVEGVVVTIVGYYFGSSSGSKTKTEIIEEELDKKNT